MNYYKHSRQIYQLVALLFILLLIFFLQPAPISFSDENLIPPFVPSGHFETNFLPQGTMTLGDVNIIFLRDLTRSQDGGRTWRVMAKPRIDYEINVIAPSPKIATDNTLFVGTMYGIHISTDQSMSWRYPQQPINKPISTIVVSPYASTNLTLYAAGRNYISIPHLYRSTDSGEHWQSRNIPQRYSEILQMVLSPSDATNQTLYIRFDDHSLWRTTNGGTTWNRIDNGLGTDDGNQVHDLGVAPLGPNGDILIVATQWGLVLSLDWGQTWYLLSTKVFKKLLIPPDFASTLNLLGIHTSRLFRSTDLGATWTMPLPNNTVSDIDVSPDYLNDHMLFTRNNEALWVSSNGGSNWQQRSGPMSSDDYGISQIVLSPNYENDGTLFVSVGLSGQTENDVRLLRSTDFGSTWTIQELEGTGYIQVAISPNFATDHTVLATRNEKLYRSIDGGIHWALISSLPFAPVTNHSRIYLSPDYTHDRTIFVSHYWCGLYRSTNNGASWVQMGPNQSAVIADFAISPGYPGDLTLYLSIYDAGIYRSTNGGTSWDLLPSPGFSNSWLLFLSPDFVQDDTLFVAGMGMYRSMDRGSTWTDITDPEFTTNIQGFAVSPHFAQDQTIVAGKSGSYLYISEDAGITWFQLDQITNIGGLMFNVGGLTLGYKNGLLQPIAGNDSVYFYQWPTEIRPPTSIGIPLEPNSTEPGSIAIPLPQSDQGIHWGVTENTPWLTVNPLTGPLTTPMVFTVDPTAVTIPASTTINVGIYYSTKQARFYNVPVQAFYAPYHAYFPVLNR